MKPVFQRLGGRYYVRTIVAVAIAFSTGARAETDLTGLSLEDLMNMHVSVTLAAKKPQSLADVASAIYVLTAEDIRRSGANSVPEALRLVPGLEVARINNGAWAVTARGFNSELSNKLLVLVDGRSIYNPMFGGVLWETQGVMMEDIDRIEVIRGPGATLWGANAVNGVINIITKPSSATTGGLVSASAGTAEKGAGAVRFGAPLGQNGSFRIDATIEDWTTQSEGSNNDATITDPYVSRTFGFRTDSTLSAEDTLTTSGRVASNIYGETSTVPSLSPPYSYLTRVRNDEIAGDALARWEHKTSAVSEFSLQAFYSHDTAVRAFASANSNVYDIEFQDRFPLADTHDLVWGAGFRANRTNMNYTPFLQGINPSIDNNVGSAFVQDEIALMPEHLKLTIGTKLEHNDFNGFEVEPSARIIWTPDAQNSIWAAISRAVRTPSGGEEDFQGLEAVVPTRLAPAGLYGLSNHLGSDKELTYEAGYRVQPLSNVSLDLALFYNDLSNLRTNGMPTVSFGLTPVPHYIEIFPSTNQEKANTYGAELAAEWQPVHGWRLRSNYTFFNGQSHLESTAVAGSAAELLGEPPHHQFLLQSSADLPHDIEVDITMRYVSALQSVPVGSYATVDVRLGWRPSDRLDFSVVGQNLLGDAHTEFDSALDSLPTIATKVDKRGFIKATYRY